MYEGQPQGISNKVSPVIEKVDIAQKALSEARGRFDILRNRLSPICRPNPKIAGEPEKAPPASLSPLALRQEALICDIQSFSREINELLEELDI